MTMLARFEDQWAVALTTFRRDGTPVSTAVNIAVVDGRAFFRTYGSAGKAKRLRNNPAVAIEPSTVTGRPTGKPLSGTARLLQGQENLLARRAINSKHGIFQRIIVLLGHRLTRKRTVHYEFVPTPADAKQPSGR